MDPYAVPEEILKLSNELPRFPDGRIDYTHASEAPVLNVFVVYNGKLLLLKRGEKVGWLKNRWHIIAGFLDEERPLAEKVFEELEEELGVTKDNVKRIEAAEQIIDPDNAKRWIVYPVLVELAELPEIKLDWENTTYEWVDPGNLESYDVIPNVLKLARELL